MERTEIPVSLAVPGAVKSRAKQRIICRNFAPSGNYLFVALESTREVSIVDAYGGREINRIPVGRAPDGLVVSPDGQKLFVNNFMDRTVSVVDLSNLMNGHDGIPAVTAQLKAVATEKLAANVLLGKQLFYDAKDTRLARDGYLSCAVCHNDGGHDGRVWDLTGSGEGLRNTIDLRGRGGTGHGLLHWTGNFDEIQDFEGQIRNLAGGTGLMTDANFTATQNTLGTAKAGLSADLDALAAYVGSLSTFQNSPYRNADGSLTTDAVAGKALFASAGCTQCHGSSPFTDSPSRLLHNVGTIKPASGQRLGAALNGLDSPTLRDVWNTAPYLHDGSAYTLEAAIGMHGAIVLTASEVNQVAAYVRQIGGAEPAPANASPSVALAAPANASTFTAGATINLSANAGDTDGTVVKVEFYADGTTLIGTSTNAPYNASISNLAVGSHALTAKAYDNYGAVATSVPANVTVQATTAVSAIFGNAGGTAFTDVVAANQNLTGINLRAGWWIDSIQGITNTGALAQHGGTGGGLATATLSANEYLVRIYGGYGSYIGQIRFVTNTGRILGPYGSGLEGNNTYSFNYTVPASTKIVGFTGRTSSYLNAIGVVYRPI